MARALHVLPDDVDVVLVHDAARPLMPSEVVDAVTQAVRGGANAVVPAIPVSDTIKQVDTAGRVERTVDREHLRAAQTPQGFARIVLESAHRQAQEEGIAVTTDDAGLVEQVGDSGDGDSWIGGRVQGHPSPRPSDGGGCLGAASVDRSALTCRKGRDGSPG